jgi:hypothetical protein
VAPRRDLVWERRERERVEGGRERERVRGSIAHARRSAREDASGEGVERLYVGVREREAGGGGN